jgi:hypothetical protein
MANTDKKNFKCDSKTKWEPAMDKAAAMRDAGYDVDLTFVLNAAIVQFRDETAEQTAERLGLVKSDKPVKTYRAPRPRRVAA